MNNFWSVLRQCYEGQEKNKRPFLALAPIAGYTDEPMRLMCKKYGVDVTYSEMISSEAIWHNRRCHPESALGRDEGSHLDRDSSPAAQINLKNGRGQNDNNKALYKTLRLIQFSEAERPYVVQIFGSNPEHMAYAASYIASGEWFNDYKIISNFKSQILNQFQISNLKLKIETIPDGIDINMGCPARDVTKTGAGAALMKDPKLACDIVKAIKKQVKNIPVSVKTRLGWAKHDEILDFSKKLEKAGADAIAIHGRTYKEGFSGPVDWEMIEEVKKTLNIPVIGNGGINYSCHSEQSEESQSTQILHCVQDDSKLDGIMIGTGAIGKPWIFQNLKSQILNLKNKVSLRDDNINFIKKNILEHATLYKDIKGDNMVEFRKILVWYLKGLPEAGKARKMAVKVENLKDIQDMIKYL